MDEICADCRHVLVVEDEETLRLPLVDFLESRGARVTAVDNGNAGIEALLRADFDLVFTDIRLPGADGFQILKRALEISAQTCVVVMTAYADVSSAVRAMRMGAHDYLAKPFSFDSVDTVLLRSCRQSQLVRERDELRREADGEFAISNIIACSIAMQQVLDTVKRVAHSDASVVLQGETGSGKELVAEALHRLSPRHDKRLVKLNCAAVPETLIESEMFGHERGAFTGAVARKRGRFEVADGGTLFLDEIADLSPAGQAKLLRVLQDRTFERVGGVDTLKVDVRFIAASHRDLRQLAQEGKFREDLYYRIGVITIRVPPLRERQADIEPLTRVMVGRASQQLRRTEPDISDEVIERLKVYPFPGNVRELANLTERAVTLCDGDRLEEWHFPPEVRASNGADADDPAAAFLPLQEASARFEQEYVSAALRRTGGRKTEAAKLLGISRKTLWARMKDVETQADEATG